MSNIISTLIEYSWVNQDIFAGDEKIGAGLCVPSKLYSGNDKRLS